MLLTNFKHTKIENLSYYCGNINGNIKDKTSNENLKSGKKFEINNFENFK